MGNSGAGGVRPGGHGLGEGRGGEERPGGSAWRASRTVLAHNFGGWISYFPDFPRNIGKS